jgi:hypothetical protein
MLDLFQAIGGSRIAIMTDVRSERAFAAELAGKIMDHFGRIDEEGKRDFLAGIISSACDVICNLRGHVADAESAMMFVPVRSGEGEEESGPGETEAEETKEAEAAGEGTPPPEAEAGESAPPQAVPEPQADVQPSNE